MRQCTEEDITLDGSISPFISAHGVIATWWGFPLSVRVGMWQLYDKSIHLDYSLKFFGIPVDPIPCEKHEVKKKLVELFNASFKSTQA